MSSDRKQYPRETGISTSLARRTSLVDALHVDASLFSDSLLSIGRRRCAFLQNPAAVSEVLTEGRQRGPLRGVHGAIKDRDHGTCSDGGDEGEWLGELVGCVSLVQRAGY